ncbi:MAG: hypothetical protein Q8R04_01390 [Nanoarchaeota archaeon]|nr:hypothetical protein [Nanoarchaeota archaeon]
MHKISLTGIILFLLLIAGCSSSSTQKTDDINVRIGFSGLTAEFLKGTPPAKMFEGNTFPALIKVKNNGAYSIKNGQAILSLGVEKDYTKKTDLLTGGRINSFEGLSNAASFGLEGKSSINPIGSEEVISYNLVAGKVDPQSETHTSTVIATLCYPYKTVLTGNVCVDTDVNNLRPAKKVCNMQDLVFGNGQGAPVVVTNIEVNMLPVISSGTESAARIKPQFLIYIENKGPGTVIKEESVRDFCTKSGTEHKNLNVVYVDAYLSNTKLRCQLDVETSPTERGHIKLKDKKDIMWCDLAEGIPAVQDPYLSPLKIELSYGYTQSISANYIIQKTAR